MNPAPTARPNGPALRMRGLAEDILGRKVDIVPRADLKPELADAGCSLSQKRPTTGGSSPLCSDNRTAAPRIIGW